MQRARIRAMTIELKLPTLEEWLAFGDKKIEVVDGEFVEMSPNTRRQPNVVTNLLLNLGTFVRDQKIGKCLPEASYVLDGNRRENWVRNARTPDLSFITQARLEAHDAAYPSQDEPYWLSPDLAVEVISLTDETQDVM